MAGFLDRMFGRSPTKGTSSLAKERLQFILVHDRINLPPERLEAMKAEILAVISKYVDVDNKNVDIALQKRQRDSLLVAEIPFSKPTKVSSDLDENEEALRTRPVIVMGDDEDTIDLKAGAGKESEEDKANTEEAKGEKTADSAGEKRDDPAS